MIVVRARQFDAEVSLGLWKTTKIEIREEHKTGLC